MDGSPAAKVPVELESVEGPVVLTAVRLVEPVSGGVDEPSASCAEAEWESRAVPRAVVRVGAEWESATLREASGRAVLGCDNGSGANEKGRRWCSGASGRLVGGRLRDPRLDILCTTADGVRLGFAWIEPDPGARYLVVRGDRYSEAYELAGDLPVRVVTRDVQLESSSADFELSEHDASGHRLRRQTFRTYVAG